MESKAKIQRSNKLYVHARVERKNEKNDVIVVERRDKTTDTNSGGQNGSLILNDR